MIYLGLDLSTVSTGYSIFNDSKLVESGKVIPPETTDVMLRIENIASKIEKVYDNYLPDKVIIEDVYYGTNYLTTKILNRLAGAVFYAIAYKKSIVTITFVTPTGARKSLGLLPKSTKQNIINIVNEKFNKNFKLKDNDEADAIVLGYYGYWKTQQPNEVFKEDSKKFFKTNVRGLKTPPLKGVKDNGRKS